MYVDIKNYVDPSLEQTISWGSRSKGIVSVCKLAIIDIKETFIFPGIHNIKKFLVWFIRTLAAFLITDSLLVFMGFEELTPVKFWVYYTLICAVEYFFRNDTTHTIAIDDFPNFESAAGLAAGLIPETDGSEPIKKSLAPRLIRATSYCSEPTQKSVAPNLTRGLRQSSEPSKKTRDIFAEAPTNYPPPEVVNLRQGSVGGTIDYSHLGL